MFQNMNWFYILIYYISGVTGFYLNQSAFVKLFRLLSSWCIGAYLLYKMNTLALLSISTIRYMCEHKVKYISLNYITLCCHL